MNDDFAARLLAWYETHSRDLPWRHTRDPYHIWLAEVMLTQTKVRTVIPYYKRFLARFPDVHALASASLDDVLKYWEGLGYYARARNLHLAAQQLVAEYDGQFPADRETWIALPGIGGYIAGSILSIAFGQNVSAVDGNARRVLCRVFLIQEDTALPATQRRLTTLAQSLLPLGRAGDFNQALMDLGAMICSPTTPRCEGCPLADICRARAMNMQGEVPLRRKRRKLPHYDIVAGVIWKGDQILIDRRPPKGLLGSLWEFPGGKLEPGETPEEALSREVREELGIEVIVRQHLLTTKHAYTHFSITLDAFHCQYLSGTPQCIGCAEWKWIRVEELEAFAFPGANQPIIEALRNQAGCPDATKLPGIVE
ncbi:MAG: A/G-specific adenine glycosylase [Chloroflexi bacterium]|nr:A/G-specific adenine glycosylase [Chloroflexota bacterium]